MTEEQPQEEEKKIVIDDDWKSQVEAEKEQLAKQMEQQQESSQEQQLPPASFATLLSTLATQVLATLGQLPDPADGQSTVNKPIAKHLIDTIAMLEEKTKGNLDDEEAKMLDQILHELRMVFVSVKEIPTEQEKPASKIELP